MLIFSFSLSLFLGRYRYLLQEIKWEEMQKTKQTWVDVA
jgi:hypothetical protein